MKNKKSFWVAVLGWVFTIYGFLGFLWSLIFSQSFWKNDLWVNCANLSFKIYNVYRNSECEKYFKILFDKLFSDHSALLISYFFLIPVLFFIIFLGGMGILRLENKWRKATINAFIVLMFTKFIFELYLKSYIFMATIVGKLSPMGSKEVVSEIEEVILMLPKVIFQDLLIKVVLISIVMFCLNHPKVVKQFYR